MLATRLRLFLLAALLSPALARGQVTQAVYTDGLQNGWQIWGWATINPAASSPVHGGAQAISVTAANWEALYLHASAPVDPASFTGLTFWVNGGATGGQVVQVQGTINNVGQTAIALAPLPTNTWRQVTVSLAGLGFTGGLQMDGFWLQVPTHGCGADVLRG
jgi:alpha-N-arabinofuranosidase